MHFLIEPFQHGFMITALLAALLVGISCACLGNYVYQRRMSMIGDALAHATFPGLVLAHLVGWSLSLGAFLAAITTALLIAWLTRKRAEQQDSAITIVFTGMFAVGVLLLSTTRSSRDLTHLLFGNLLATSWHDVLWITCISLVVGITLMLFHKELVLTTIDPHHSSCLGIPVERLRLVLLLLLALTIVSAVQVAGVILTTSFLITPAATADSFKLTWKRTMLLSICISFFAVVTGLILAYHLNISCGSTVIVILTVVFVVSLPLKYWRGL
jgi:ABC-type Mn2+/Zn2+ transport system permease subunit